MLYNREVIKSHTTSCSIISFALLSPPPCNWKAESLCRNSSYHEPPKRDPPLEMPVHFHIVFSAGNGVSQGRRPQVPFDFSFLLGSVFTWSFQFFYFASYIESQLWILLAFPGYDCPLNLGILLGLLSHPSPLQ